MVATSWTPVTSQADADALMKLFGGFHDGCIREAHILAQSFVDSGMSMRVASGVDTRIRLLIQRQWKDPSSVELLFAHIDTFHLRPSPENYDSIIYTATMLCRDDMIYWADMGGWTPESPDRDDATWIAAKKLSWRNVSEWMGPDLRYGPGDAEI